MLSQSFNGIQNVISTKPDSINSGEYIKSIDSNIAVLLRWEIQLLTNTGKPVSIRLKFYAFLDPAIICLVYKMSNCL